MLSLFVVIFIIWLCRKRHAYRGDSCRKMDELSRSGLRLATGQWKRTTKITLYVLSKGVTHDEVHRRQYRSSWGVAAQATIIRIRGFHVTAIFHADVL